MIFYNDTTKQGICQEIDRLCSSNDTSYPRLDKTSRVNTSLEELIGKIISTDGVWEWDDTNQTDLPVGTGTLVQGQERYSFAAEYLKLKRMKVADVNGNWQPLKQIDQSDLDHSGLTIEEYFGTDSSGNPTTGLPTHYDILGDSFRLYPAPTSTAVTLAGGTAGGVKVEFERTAVLFTAVSTTATDSTEPGLPSTSHVILAYMASIPYCMAYYPERVSKYEAKVEQMTKDLLDFFSKRNPDRRSIMTNKYEPYF